MTTPDAWLLEAFDHGKKPYMSSTAVSRPLFQLLDDHPTSECTPVVGLKGGECRSLSGEASWPEPRLLHRLRPIPAIDSERAAA